MTRFELFLLFFVFSILALWVTENEKINVGKQHFLVEEFDESNDFINQS